jgi:isoquinoline 1-oxidoreductase beta subunit
MTSRKILPRRDFLVRGAAVAGALCVGVRLPGAAVAADAGAVGSELASWVVIHPDNTVVIRVARSELGQGSFTGLVQLVAEELECAWSLVRPEYADVNEHVRRNRVWGGMSTGGSRSVRESHEYLRKAGAAAREMLVTAAAGQWGVPVSECRAADSVITHVPTGRTVTFGQVAAAAAKLEVPKEVRLKDPKEWKVIGTSPRRFDIPDKTTGRQIYAADVRLPGMLHASIAQCPVFGGRLKSWDEAAVLGMRGVRKVVAGEDFVAVVADNWWRANQAVKALPVVWDDGGNGSVSSDSIRAFLRSGIDAVEAPVVRRDGDAAAALPGAARVVEAEYYAPYLNHATLEPQTATALYRGDTLEVWVGTQNGEATIAAASEAAGIPLEKVTVNKMHAGGGFGRRGPHQEYTKQAVRIAMSLPGTAVRLQWSREEDMQQGRYRPVALVRQRAGLDGDGNWTAWHVRQADQSILTSVRPGDIKNGIDPVGARVFSDSPYAVPNYTSEYAMRNTHVPPGFWRAVAHTHNPVFRECFIDELCQAAGKDPYQFRRPLLARKEKDLGVLDAVAKAAGWGSVLPAGVFRGIAVSDSYGSFTAAVVELSVADGAAISVRRVLVAIDSGYIVHRDAVVAQIESGVVWSLSMAMHEEITIEGGRVVQGNFTDYPVLRLAEMPPRIEAVIVPTGGFWGGVGEPPLAAVTPALCNALFAATGRRIRSLPLRHHGFHYA